VNGRSPELIGHSATPKRRLDAPDTSYRARSRSHRQPTCWGMTRYRKKTSKTVKSASMSFLTAILGISIRYSEDSFLSPADSLTEPFSSCVCLADLQYVDGLGELPGAPGAAAEDAPGLELGVRALAG